MEFARRIVSALVMAGCALALGGCAGTPRALADLHLESAEATTAVFASVEPTECPELTTCLERANAPLPVVRTVRSSGTSPSSPGEPVTDEAALRRAELTELVDRLENEFLNEMEPIVTELP